MKITLSNSAIIGTCKVRTEHCDAPKQANAITIVYDEDNEQINVCQKCLDEMVRSGKWENES